MQSSGLCQPKATCANASCNAHNAIEHQSEKHPIDRLFEGAPSEDLKPEVAPETLQALSPVENLRVWQSLGNMKVQIVAKL